MKPAAALPNARAATTKPAKLSSERGLLILIAAYTVVSFLCTFTALNTNAVVETVYAVTTRVYPTIPGLAYYSGKTNETTLYYSIYLVTLPAVVFEFNRQVETVRFVRPVQGGDLKLALAIVFVLSVAALITFCIAFLEINTSASLKLTGGRGDALFIGLTANWLSRGATSACVCFAICFFTSLALYGSQILAWRIRHARNG